MKASLVRFWRRDSGATTIEYAMIAAGIVLAIVASLTKLGGNRQRLIRQRSHGSEIEPSRLHGFCQVSMVAKAIIAARLREPPLTLNACGA
jgi:Flp pilus assembly pilin Flp